jgi:ComF family protein
LIEAKFLSDETIDKIDSVFLFEQDNRVREAVHLLKYGGAEAIAERFGFYISKKIVNDDMLSLCDVVSPVPLHPARRRERGYNQSELIARSVGRILRVAHEPGLLVRVRQTQTQTSFDAEGRKKNVKGAFGLGKVSANEVNGKKILLIDDVITTGATIKECARTLKSNGASEVYAVSAAIAI